MRNYIEKLFSKSKGKVEEDSKYVYQIQEFDGKIWFTFNGALICPTELFKDEALSTLEVIRKLYVERNTIEE